MALSYKRIYRIVITNLSNLLNKQIGVESIIDSDLGFKMWGGKDGEGTVTKFLAKDENASVNSLKCTQTIQSTLKEGVTHLDFANPVDIINPGNMCGLKIFRISGGHEIYEDSGKLIIDTDDTVEFVTNSGTHINGLFVTVYARINSEITFAKSLSFPISTVISDDYVITGDDHLIQCDDGGLDENATLTLPKVSDYPGIMYHIHISGKNEGGYHFVLTPHEEDTIETDLLYLEIDTRHGTLGLVNITIQSDGVNKWKIIHYDEGF